MAAVNAGVDDFLATLLAPPTTSSCCPGRAHEPHDRPEEKPVHAGPTAEVERQAIMLPISEYEIGLGFTEDGLQEMSLDNFQAQVDGMVAGFDMLVRAEVLSRLFNDAEVPVDAEHHADIAGLRGSGTGSNVFAGTYPDNTALPGGYSHYYRDSTANFIATVKAQRDRLRKWHQPPFDFIGSDARVAALVADAAFVSAGSALIRVGVSTNEALVDADTYVGVFDKDIRVRRSLVDFTTDQWALYKTYGALSPRNALAWRYDPCAARTPMSARGSCSRWPRPSPCGSSASASTTEPPPRWAMQRQAAITHRQR
jgi:hypothetical protein